MKKKDQNSKPINVNIAPNKDIYSDKFKTTNVNILLNRVRSDKKRDLKRKLIFFIFFALIIIPLITYLS